MDQNAIPTGTSGLRCRTRRVSALLNSRVCGFQFSCSFGQANKKHHPIYVMIHRHPVSGNRVVLFKKYFEIMIFGSFIPSTLPRPTGIGLMTW